MDLLLRGIFVYHTYNYFIVTLCGVLLHQQMLCYTRTCNLYYSHLYASINLNLYFIIYSLGVEPIDHDILKSPPRKVRDRIINRSLLINVLLSASIIVIGTLLVFWIEVDILSVSLASKLRVIASSLDSSLTIQTVFAHVQFFA